MCSGTLQAIGRVHRIGQYREAHVLRFVVENTVETNVYSLAAQRAAGMDMSCAAVVGRGSAGATSAAEHGALSVRDVALLLNAHWSSGQESHVFQAWLCQDFQGQGSGTLKARAAGLSGPGQRDFKGQGSRTFRARAVGLLRPGQQDFQGQGSGTLQARAAGLSGPGQRDFKGQGSRTLRARTCLATTAGQQDFQGQGSRTFRARAAGL
eukprot:gene18132-24571_t